ncbi:hypothetical protein [Vibrio cholerae]|uniref:hypothetical protein n=1 Tax=Vibrio cholerae TaxID=666 RepID=UPI001583CDBE|nr:hypothetical protein [Vibrio cholerae]EGR2119206.1 hypothetical protein [Vibrio cholerae]QKU83241.1 hypothetical protein HPY07_12650 [Vibrio cholerae]
MNVIILICISLSIILPSKIGVFLFFVNLLLLLASDLIRRAISINLVAILFITVLLLIQNLYFNDFYFDGVKIIALFYLLLRNYVVFSRYSLLVISKIVVVLSFLIIVLQMVFPHFHFWGIISENQYQYANFSAGYAPLSSTGHPTHAAYINMISSVVLFMGGGAIFYPLLGFISLLLLKNKVCLFVYFLAISVFLLNKRGFRIVLLLPIVIFAGTVAYYVLFSHYINEWSESSFNAHTINHRLELLNGTLERLKEFRFILLGEPHMVVYAGDYPFDSLFLLLVTRYGIPLTLFLYIFIFRLSMRVGGLPLFIAITMPSLTAITFYHFSFIIYVGALLSMKESVVLEK